MTTVVIMPGGFHPYHAGHHALYQSAQRTFPDAEVYVAATNDTSSRPFPFAVKEKLAKLAGVEAGHFVQVKSPFRAEEITSKFDPQKDVLIFVRSEKDAKSPPQPGGVKKDGSPSYLQPLLGAKRLEPFSKHAYMAYLPTVEFGPGMTSATQIRAAWPGLDERRKTALVMSLYPRTQTSPQLAQTVVKLLDAAIGGEQGVAEGSDGWIGNPAKWKEAVLQAHGPDVVFKNYTHPGQPGKRSVNAINTQGKQVGVYQRHNKMGMVQPSQQGVAEGAPIVVALAPIDVRNPKKAPQPYRNQGDIVPPTNPPSTEKRGVKGRLGQRPMPDYTKDVDENQGWAATFTNEETRAYGGQQGAGMTAAYQRRENQPVDERKQDSEDMPAAYRRDPELYKLRQYAKQHYSQYADDPEMAMMKLLQRGMEHSEINDQQHDRKLAALAREIQSVRSELRQQQNEDYLEEKWSEKYKSSINCAAPQGFSQRAHCDGRKK
jgi:hypothetical protein